MTMQTFLGLVTTAGLESAKGEIVGSIAEAVDPLAAAMVPVKVFGVKTSYWIGLGVLSGLYGAGRGIYKDIVVPRFFPVKVQDLGQVTQTLNGFKTRIDGLENRLSDLATKTEMKDLESQVKDVNSNMIAMEKRLMAAFANTKPKKGTDE